MTYVVCVSVAMSVLWVAALLPSGVSSQLLPLARILLYSISDTQHLFDWLQGIFCFHSHSKNLEIMCAHTAVQS